MDAPTLLTNWLIDHATFGCAMFLACAAVLALDRSIAWWHEKKRKGGRE